MSDLYRATDLKSGEVVEFSVRDAGEPISIDAETGSAVEPSAEEIAKSLANPNTPLVSQIFKFRYRLFDGDLPDADEQDGAPVLYQPAFPFPLDNGAIVFFRPAFPIIVDQPVYDGTESDFDFVNGIGDIGFDLAYGRTTRTGDLPGRYSWLRRCGCQPDAFGPQWMFGINIVPVLENLFARILK